MTYIYKDNRRRDMDRNRQTGRSYSGLNNRYSKTIIVPNWRCQLFYEDGEGKLWLGFDGEGIASYDKDKNTYTYYKSKNKEIPSDLIVCSFHDNKGRVWWGSFGGGAFYYQNGQFTPLKAAENNPVELPQYIRRITQDNAGNLWFATYSQGLYAWNLPEAQMIIQ